MKKIRLSDIADITMGQSPPGESCSENKNNGGVPLLNGPTEFTDFYPLAKQYTTDPKRFSKKGNILFCVRGSTTGRMNWSDKQYAIGRGLAAISHKKGVEYNHFLKYLIQDNLASILKSTGGSTFPNLTGDLLSSFEVYVPESSVQKTISSILASLDGKIYLNIRFNFELEAMAKTIYDYWFVQFDFPNAKGKPYKSSGGKMVLNEKLKREIPEGWSVGSLLDIAEYVNGLPCQKFRPKGNDTLRVIKIKEMHEGFSEDSELVRADIPDKAIIENGDVLFAWSASLEVQIWTGGKGALNQHIFKVTSEKYPKAFYYYQLLNYLQHFKMMAENRKTTMGHITQDHLEQSRIVIPPVEIAEQLEKVIAPIFEKKMNNELQNHSLSSLRDWLLPMLMNGQVKVKEAEEELRMVAEGSIEYT